MSGQPEPVPRRESVLSIQLDLFEDLYDAVLRAERDERGIRLVRVCSEGSDERLFVVDKNLNPYAQMEEEMKKRLKESVFAWSEEDAKKALEGDDDDDD